MYSTQWTTLYGKSRGRALNTIRCVAVDDEPRALQVVQRHAQRTPFLDLVASFVDPVEALAYLNAHTVDVLLIDIQIPDLDGLSLVRQLKKVPLLIFTTAHSEYAVESYEVEAVDYLLKPFDYPRFLQAASKVQQRLYPGIQPFSSSGFLFLNTGSQKQRVMMDELRVLEGEGNYVNYMTETSTYLVRTSIKQALRALPADQFVQIHRSYVVALRHIDKIEDHFVFIGNKHFPVGATYRSHFYERIEQLG